MISNGSSGPARPFPADRGRVRRAILLCLALAVLQILGSAGEARAQPRVPLIVVLVHGTESLGRLRSDLLREGLRELGYVEGTRYRMEVRTSDDRQDRLPELARELLRLNPAVAVGVTGLAAQAFWTETRSVPIVIAAGVATPEMIATLARPGGNVTGVLNQSAEFTPKLLELLRDVAPRAERVVALSSGRGLIEVEVRELSRIAAKTLGMTLIEAVANSPEEIEQLAARCERERCEAVVTLPDPTLPGRLAEPLAALLARLRLPDVSNSVAFGRDHGLVGFEPDRAWATRRTAHYVDRILKGARPADLPAERGENFQLVINVRTAKALGITVPQSVLVRADEIVE